MSNSGELHDSGTPDRQALLATYSELCTSYNAIREFRAKLLGFLPLASAGGVFLLLNAAETNIGPLTLVAIGLYGAVFLGWLYVAVVGLLKTIAHNGSWLELL